MSSGYVYVISNPSMSGMVKIGRSINGGRFRARDLYAQATGVPTPFKLEFEMWVDDHEELEILVHEKFQGNRVSESREFFILDVHEAIKGIIQVYGDRTDHVFSNRNHVVDEDSIALMMYRLADDGFYGITNVELVNALREIDAGTLKKKIAEIVPITSNIILYQERGQGR